VAGRLRLDLAQYRELEAFAKFGSDLDKATLAQIIRGQRMVEVLKQGQYAPVPVEKQIAIIFLGVNGYLDDIPVEKIGELEKQFYTFLESNYAEVLKAIVDEKEISDETQKKLTAACEEFIKLFKVEA